MKRLALLLVLVPSIAYAQAPKPSPAERALQQEVIQLTGEKLNAVAAVIASQDEIEADKAQIADLQKKLDAAKKAPEVPPH